MSQFYVACNFGLEHVRVTLGQLHNGQLQVSEIRRFPNVPLVERNSVQWNIPQLYQELMEGLRTIAAYEEPVQSISCSSFPGEYLLFDEEGALITPSLHNSDPQAVVARTKLAPEIPWETVFQETGTHRTLRNMFLQLGAETSKRLKHARYVLPVADAFNFLLGGEARIEQSMACATQLFNPVSRQWSGPVLSALRIRPNLLPPVVSAGTTLGSVREAICQETRLEDTRVVASCSEELAVAMAGLPVADNECWAFLKQGSTSVLGMLIPQPIINDASHAAQFSSQTVHEGLTCFQKQGNGLQILTECQQFWAESDRSIDNQMLSHLAGSAAPFESLIDPGDTRFFRPGDMPLKIQTFCKETNQSVPRKPGPVYRCVLESLALHYRKLLQEVELLTGTSIERVYVLGDDMNMLLNHFTANAIQRPVTVINGDIQAIGNLVIQALALRHIPSIEEARAVLRASCKLQSIVPHANLWEDAFDRFVSLRVGETVPA